jgi:hypothetical protein
LRTYSKVVGGHQIQSAIDALELFVRIKATICGSRNTKACIEEYGSSGQLGQALKKVFGNLNWSFLNGGPTDIFNGLAEINNLILNVGLCDLLQDDKIQRRVGHNRDEFCDARGLKRYRLVASKELTRVFKRPVDDLGEGTTFSFEDGPDGREFMLKVPLMK